MLIGCAVCGVRCCDRMGGLQAMRDEFCKKIVDLGCLDYVLPALEKFTDVESVAYAACCIPKLRLILLIFDEGTCYSIFAIAQPDAGINTRNVGGALLLRARG